MRQACGVRRLCSFAGHSGLRQQTKQSVPGLPLIHGSWDSPFVVLNKPPGLPCQSIIQDDDTVESRILKHFHGRKKPIFPHRLDKDTQGLLAITFNPSVAGAISKLHSDKRKWLKQYRVLTDLPQLVSSVLPEHPAYTNSLAPRRSPFHNDQSIVTLHNPNYIEIHNQPFDLAGPTMRESHSQ
eukprot:c8812_g2_i1.p1 GENE.c8812_g2_i1~~c8812_g2_i1.p1  ORF type:complete len:183 (-),score=20.06 c8812_g2_i1:684-1232(-)